MVPRDGIEVLSIYLKSCAFLKAHYFVYPTMYPTPSSHSAGGGAPTDSGGLEAAEKRKGSHTSVRTVATGRLPGDSARPCGGVAESGSKRLD